MSLFGESGSGIVERENRERKDALVFRLRLLENEDDVDEVYQADGLRDPSARLHNAEQI